jgi:hypothetical protein
LGLTSAVSKRGGTACCPACRVPATRLALPACLPACLLACLLLCSDADALRWCLHIAQALQYLHESLPAVVHRDLKLENVMLSSADVALASALVADFGMGRPLPKSDAEMLQRL